MSDLDAVARELLRVSKALKASDKTLRRDYHKQLRESAKPLLPKVRESARQRFPSRGGLAAHMAQGKRYSTVVRTGDANAGVSIRANRTDPRTDSQGRIVHPIPKVGGTKVAAHEVTSTSVKTRKTRTKQVAAKVVGGEFVRDEKGRKVVAVQVFPEARGYFRDPLLGSADSIMSDLRRTVDEWAGRVARGA